MTWLFSFRLSTRAEGVREVQKRYSKVLEETDESENENQTDNSIRNTGTQLSFVVFYEISSCSRLRAAPFDSARILLSSSRPMESILTEVLVKLFY